jgi:CheY-like chemotaxis protein
MAKFCIIEDNLPIRKLFATLLKKSGYETHEYSDGNSALKGINTDKPDAILMDILLPDTNGTELLKKVRLIEGMEKVPIVAVTGFAQANDEQKYLEHGFDGYIAKPINTASFVSDLKSLVE